MKCPKCPGHMRTYNRAGVQIEQCDTCRGVFLDYGELEAVTQAEAMWSAPPPPHVQHSYAPPPWAHGGHGYHHKKKSFANIFFSS